MHTIIRSNLLEIVRDSLRDDRDESRRVISFWGPRGSGKTTLLAALYKTLSKQKELDVQRVFDVSRPRDYNQLLDLLADSPRDPKSSRIVLIDNLDSLCSEDREDLGRLEWRLDDLVENTKARIIFTSSVEPNFLYELQLQIRMHSTKMTSFSEKEIEGLALPGGISPKTAYQLSLGYPAALSWAAENKVRSARKIATIAMDYFFGDLDEPTRKMASVACITPLFDVYLLTALLSATDRSLAMDDFGTYVNRLRTLVLNGIIVWDINRGNYRFSNDSIRRLCAGYFALDRDSHYRKLNRIASKYFAEEARGPSFAFLAFPSIYHRIFAYYPDIDRAIRNCRRWISKWSGGWFRGMGAEELRNQWKAFSQEYPLEAEIEDFIGAGELEKLLKFIERTSRGPVGHAQK